MKLEKVKKKIMYFQLVMYIIKRNIENTLYRLYSRGLQFKTKLSYLYNTTKL